MSAAHLPQGDYDFHVALVNSHDGQVMGRDRWRISVVPEGNLQDRTAYIDEHNRLILNGQPFFPLGMYWSGISEDRPEDLR